MSDADKPPEVYEYDVLLSHSSRDKDVVRDLANRLRDDGLRVWFDEWEIQPGDHIGIKIDRALESSRILLLFMSANFFASDWATFESHTFRFRDPTNRDRRFIPVRLDGVTIPTALSAFAYVNWQQRADEQYAKLLKACRSSVKQPRRARKTTGSGTQQLREPKTSATRQALTNAGEGQILPVRILKKHTIAVLSVAVSPTADASSPAPWTRPYGSGTPRQAPAWPSSRVTPTLCCAWR